MAVAVDIAASPRFGSAANWKSITFARCGTAVGGLDNLVYACTICNRFKSDYWPADAAPDNLRLLHPFKDDLGAHVLQTSDGRLVGQTPRGWFHIDRLHLNRPLLVELRRIRHAELLLRQELDQVQTINAQMQKRIWALEIELAELRELIARLSA